LILYVYACKLILYVYACKLILYVYACKLILYVYACIHTRTQAGTDNLCLCMNVCVYV
jgi:hypothetical protein